MNSFVQNNENLLSRRAVSLDEIFGENGLLGEFIKGMEGVSFTYSDRYPANDVVGYTIIKDQRELGIVTIPKQGIQEDIVYDIYIKGDKIPCFRFRVGQRKKVRAYRKKVVTNTDEHMDIAELVSPDGINKGRTIYFSNMFSPLHVRISRKQTLGKREAVINVVKEAIKKVPIRKK